MIIKLQPILIKALAIDEKIGYPEYIGSDNVTELEEDYADVREKKNQILLRYIYIDLI